MRRKSNLKNLLNLNIIDETNLTPKVGDLDMPYIQCGCEKIPHFDYLASYSQPSTYFQSPNTCLSFFEYDSHFDGIHGIWNGIYYRDKKILCEFKNRVCGVKYMIAPDYSKCGDVPEEENHYRQFKMRITSIWITMNTDSVVIPLVSAGNSLHMNYMLDGMENCEIVAFNAKGPMGDPSQMRIFKRSIEYTVDTLPKLKRIIVYSTSPNINKTREIFQYAINKNIEVDVPNNMLQTRHLILGDYQ